MGAEALLLSTSAWVAFLHALAPDHWLPFVALARANRWSRNKLVGVTFLAGLGHVSTSLVIGLLGLMLGQELTRIQGLEASRGNISVLLLIGFGAAYMAWGIHHARHGHEHQHLGVDNIGGAAKTVFITRFWILFAVMVFGPCEPMIPLIFLAWSKGPALLAGVIGIFSLITIAMVITQSLAAFEGLRFAWTRYEERLARHSHTIAGATILAVGLIVILFGI